MNKQEVLAEINQLLHYFENIQLILNKNQILAKNYEEEKPKSNLKYWFIIVWIITSLAIYFTGETEQANLTAQSFIVLLCILFGFVAGVSVVILIRAISDLTLKGEKKEFISSFKSTMEQNFDYIRSYALDIADNKILDLEKTSTKQLQLLKNQVEQSFGMNDLEEAKKTVSSRELSEEEKNQIEVIKYFIELKPKDTSVSKLIKASKFKVALDDE